MRWISRGLAVLAGIVVLAIVGVYGGSEWLIRKSRAVPLETIAVPNDAASVAEGGRIAKIAGCRHCHGPEGKGKVLADDPALGRIVAPALAHVAARYSNPELARAVRHGVRNDGSTLWIMPTQSYRFIADDDLGKVIGWVRSLKPGGQDVVAETRFGPVGRALILAGKLPPSVQPGKVGEKTRPAHIGRYYADAVCAGCHALDRALPAHDGKGMAPALAPAAAAYDLPAFRKLLQTGKGMGDRDLGLMAEVSRESFSALTPEEMAAIHAYLKGEAAKQGQ